ncbi:GFA family protein [Bordetella hinzii]|uniref:S-(Hydroxymethyl)glutathione synthase n=1 Tax=Bordetella hinzii OH87 BAL007II TaxID=1331262 RepID=A0ABR4R1Y5_9BORD|nr:GFA family protein [Bordetella hinzii]KCB24229.1 S-(hydroxymethyl)glutathione synthase [Bordetella hinzii OH87 BAL007II]KCB40677.1 S-(hydroxymethyl)glutathione synthase [Bordetella hinzii 5132]QDJ43623.1 aldehyde-activating protein [Bordetella hinzii]QDJ48195.1 aldehyde-activating protein [Bordetella hinzii]
MNYHGSCHCGDVRFAFEGEFGPALACNCSICQRKGSLLWFMPRDALRLETPDAPLSRYTFNSHRIAHQFCPRCGIHPFAWAQDPSGKEMAAVNIRCLEDIDLDAIGIKHYDGRAR